MPLTQPEPDLRRDSIGLKAFTNIAASTTDGALVTAVAGRRIRVVAILVAAGGTATNVTFNSKGGGAGTAISPLFALAINGTLPVPWCPQGWFDTSVGEGLTVTTGAGATTGIQVVYVLTN